MQTQSAFPAAGANIFQGQTWYVEGLGWKGDSLVRASCTFLDDSHIPFNGPKYFWFTLQRAFLGRLLSQTSDGGGMIARLYFAPTTPPLWKFSFFGGGAKKIKREVWGKPHSLRPPYLAVRVQLYVYLSA